MLMALHRGRRMLALVPVLLLLGGCAGTSHFRDTSGTFPVAPEIEPNVHFWTQVYGVWGRDKVALHDDEHLGVVYEVLTLPPGGYGATERARVAGRKASLEYQLKTLEGKVASGASLSREERALRDTIVDAAGPRAVAGASERVRVQRGIRERFRDGLEVSGRYDETFREIFRARGLPADLAYLPHVESSFQLKARSPVGAGGVWQFMPATGRLYMTVNHAVDERYDPVIAAEAAAAYLGGAHDRLGSWPLAVTSYNHGVGGMQRAKSLYGDDFGAIARRYKGPAFGFSSRNFYAQFVAAREVAGNPGKYFPEGVRFQRAVPTDKLVLRHSLPATQVASHYGLPLTRLADLNPAWRGPVKSGHARLPAGSTVWLPEGTMDRIAGQPAPLPVMVAAKAPVKAPTVAVAKAAKPAPKPVTVAQAKKPPVKHHVVKPNETLYRVALQYDLSVDDLRRINRMPPNDNTIRPGQRLRVTI